ncbi:MAG: hypothetical protein U0169_22525 [Polyangiaceae bacterium]
MITPRATNRFTTPPSLRTFASLSLAFHVALAGAAWRRVESSAETAAPDRAGGALAGETFEIDPDAVRESFASAGSEMPAPADAPATPAHGGATGTPLFEADDVDVVPASTAASSEGRMAPRAATSRTTHARPKGPASEAAPPPPPLFGAVGDRSAADLARSFTRAFASAASTSPLWKSAPLGSAGSITVTFTLDPSGKLTGQVVGPSGSAALTDSVRRTLAVIGGRTFTSRGSVTRVTLRATVSSDQVHDGLHGDVFAIGASMTGDVGSGFFALAIGRRIDVQVRAAR